MTRRLMPALAVGLFVSSQIVPFVEPVSADQAVPRTGVLRAAAQKIAEVEPNWRFTSATCNYRGPLLPEQVAIECGIWESLGQSTARTAINVTLRIVSSAAAASHWMDSTKRDRPAVGGWTSANYDLADGARMSTYLDGQQFSIDVRKGNLLMVIGAQTKSDDERFAKHLVAAVSVER